MTDEEDSNIRANSLNISFYFANIISIFLKLARKQI